MSPALCPYPARGARTSSSRVVTLTSSARSRVSTRLVAHAVRLQGLHTKRNPRQLLYYARQAAMGALASAFVLVVDLFDYARDYRPVSERVRVEFARGATTVTLLPSSGRVVSSLPALRPVDFTVEGLIAAAVNWVQLVAAGMVLLGFALVDALDYARDYRPEKQQQYLYMPRTRTVP